MAVAKEEKPAASESSEPRKVDPRLDWFEDKVCKAFKCKNDKWKKVVMIPENCDIISAFLDSVESNSILFYFNQRDDITPATAFPPNLKKKSIYFLKNNQNAAVTDKLDSELTIGDLSANPLDYLSTVLEEVYLPLLSNTKNLESWPQVVASDVLRHFHRLNSATYVISGQAKGRTLLPLPPSTAATTTENEKAALQTAEASVSQWSHQVVSVISSTSSETAPDVYPSPLVELDFWAQKSSNLKNLYLQLTDPKMGNIEEILRTHNSTYYPIYKQIHDDVVKALDEASQVHTYLRALRPFVERLTQTPEFVEIQPLLKPMIHTLMLIWTNCTHYQQPERLVVILQEIGNDLIEQTRGYMNPEEILKAEADEAVERIHIVLRVLDTFRACFSEYKEIVAKKEGVKAWNFDENLAFGRLDQFKARVIEILELFETMAEFGRLEKVEIGGTRGKGLSFQIAEIYNEFINALTALKAGKFNVLDLNSKDFTSEVGKYLEKIADLDKRIATIVCQAFDDAVTVPGCFRLIDSFGNLLSRPAIQRDIEAKYFTLLQTFGVEVDAVLRIFLLQKENPPIHYNMAPVTGTIAWVHELKDRIEKSFEKLLGFPDRISQSEEFQRLRVKYSATRSNLEAFEQQAFAKWADTIIDSSESELSKPLLVRDPNTKLLSVNFDAKVVALLREVKYFGNLGVAVPEKARSIFEKSGELNKFIFSLEQIVSQYNGILNTIMPVEAPLIAVKLAEIDRQCEAAITSLNWRNDKIEAYIKETGLIVGSLSNTLQVSKNHIEQIKNIMKEWYSGPLVDRKDGRKLLNLEEKAAKLNNFYEKVRNEGTTIFKLIEHSRVLLGAEETSENWQKYTVYVDGLLQEGLYNVIHVSSQYLLDNMTESFLSKNDLSALVECKLQLEAGELVFLPSMDEESAESLIMIVQTVIKDIYNTAALVPRIHQDASGQNYLDSLTANPILAKLRVNVSERVQEAVQKVLEYKETFAQYTFLWTENRQEFLQAFLAESTPEATAASGSAEDNAELKAIASSSLFQLDRFEVQLRKFEALHKSVMALENDSTFSGWLRVDAKPLKQSLNILIKKWINIFSKHLSDDSNAALQDLSNFIAITKKGMLAKTEDGDYHGLVASMEILQAVKHRTTTTDKIFEPIRKTITLLKSFGTEMNEEVHRLLNDLPEEWSDLKKLATSVRNHVAPLQANEVERLQKKVNAFEMKNHVFREEFRKNAPMKFDVGLMKAYTEIDHIHIEVAAMETEAANMRISADLFELSVPQYKQLADCRRDISMLKQVWDVVGVVTFLFDEWKATLWTQIDTDLMEAKCKDLAKDLRKMDKEIKGWDVFNGLDQMVKDMITSLRSVGELRSNAIRDRHWRQLMTTTGVSFSITADMKLQDLLSLNLHKFEDDVKTIVDRATKELSMEKMLNELTKTWSAMFFSYEVHEATGVPLFKCSEELIETLEDNQVMLQTMMGSKYVAHFLEQISKWQNTLGTVDSVISLWSEVQKTWSHLENIFIGSEDIRAQLPEDSKRFEGIDADYKKLMQEASKTPSAVEVCSKAGLFELLESLQSQLSLCEKALAEYLETKRLAFPRFYFVSSSDLLDILAKGNMPQKVAIHLSKLFDAIQRLEFEPDKDGQPSKVAVGMYSKEDEYVQFHEPCDCTGAVESWLNRLVTTMRKTLHGLLAEAVQMYEEKPRESWIFDYPAQVTLAGTQVWWTTEVNVAFSRLEEGYENSLKDYYKKQQAQLSNLITLIQGDLNKNNRQMIMSVCTLDVHARDVVNRLINEKAENATCFQWQAQLRLKWDENENDCFANICDAHIRYNYEYLGNTPRLVVTPLTDRCYITLTQSLHLVMGGAPAGPAGTGKTETVKDLGKALAIMVYVFNCSDQMDYKSVGNIFKGLAQSGAWGCFDEFNRIAVEVLSVVATQVKSIQDAIRSKKKRFIFQGEEISMVPTVGYFITMNPGYAGRTELPDNLKALFRPCSMVVPDLQLICEIMLMAEGFIEAGGLALKFTTLYKLNRELLSKQDHYDWGLRAIKSVLVVAGTLKRSEPAVPEEHILMRALRDFNLPKIVTDDLSVFNGLISDLFPRVDIPRKRDEKFEDEIRKATLEAGLQTEENFILKVVQLEELLQVRHCVFIIGNAGTGKSQVWKTLSRTYNNQGKKCVTADLDPKAVTTDDLYGYINPSTREWKDGLFSSILRDQASMPGKDPKWVILDGDIDPNWIESLNTVMDDNKVLTLASNERIPMKNHMRLIFEIGDLKYATPATVSRAGILYINPGDLGWLPYVQSWLERREDAAEKSNLSILFDRYVNMCLDAVSSGRFKHQPVEAFSMVQTLCNILEGLLTAKNTPKGCDKEWFEIYFVFAAVWAFGGCMLQDQLVDYRAEFSKWWNNEFKLVKFPAGGTVFDYFIDHETKRFVPWKEKVAAYEYDPDAPLQQVLVPTSETVRVRYFLDLLADVQKPVLLIGNGGSGKTVLMQDKLNAYGEDRMIVNLAFNFYTTAWGLQPALEKPLEKKAGRNYGPPGTRKLIYFVDDLNMPEVDKYGTASPHTLLRQFFDYKHWYDRQKLTLKEINNCQIVACMNPTAGSFTITPRLQRHFASFCVSFPSQESLQTIYTSILDGHLHQMPAPVQKYTERVVASALTLHKKISTTFLPTAVKFHYFFNLRDLSNVFQGMLFAGKDFVKEPKDLLRLWIHESCRVYGDKLIDSTDTKTLVNMIKDATKKGFEEVDSALVLAEPNIYTHFAGGLTESKYQPVKDWASIKKLLEEALESHNETNAVMELVLFEDAMNHVARISRILESPRGNALLVGVGGSGKQSLARLAAFISNFEVFQITLRKGYSIADLKLDLCNLYIKTGQKKQGVMFMMTDGHIADEKFLVLINDLLASGNIPGLFPDEEVENIINAMRNEVKSLGLVDTRETCWETFIKNVRKNLKVVLCFSPVGNTLRNRSRKFPAVVNCTQIDWFNEWPDEALQSVANRFLSEFELVPQELRESATKFMSFAHQAVNDVSKKYLESDRRYNYTTPKSFLEFINLYKAMLEKKASELVKSMERLENGLAKLQSTAAQVDDLKARLATQEIELATKNAEANALIEQVSTDTEKVNKEKASADAEKVKVDVINKEVGEKRAQCEKDLMAAEPALAAAENALKTLNKGNLTELKSFGSPSEDVVGVVAAVSVLLSPPGKPAKDRSWKAGKNMMGNVDAFLKQLITFDKENIDATNLTALEPYLANPDFNADFIRSKSAAASGLCAWVVNIVMFYRVFCDVEPKRKALDTANADLAAAQARLSEIMSKLDALDKSLAELRFKYETAIAAKQKCEEDARQTNETISLANRLVGGLASEKVRWSETVGKFKEQEKTLAGDVLLSAAFISYVGSFGRKYREQLINEKWLPKLKELKVPLSEGIDPLALFTNSAEIAKWNNENLPNDRMSLENGMIFTNCKRWPLIIDPQLQGITWIKNRYGDKLKIVRLGARGYLDVIEKAVSTGDIVLIEDLGTTLDPVLDPLIGRNTIKKGKYIKMGDKEVEYDSKFRLILQTKLANPHYGPEIQAQTTLINFTVTISGLEDQLLADVVNSERSDLEQTKAELTKQQNEFKIRLTELEDALLYRLSAAEGNFLGDTTLVENLEITKKTAVEIEHKVEEAKKTEKKINETRELYRPVAARASLLYFLLNELNRINPMYQYSLNAFKVVFMKAIATAEAFEELKDRVVALIDSITYAVYTYTNRGLFERDKLIFNAQMTFQILNAQQDLDLIEFDFLLRGPRVLGINSPVDWINTATWGAIKALSNLEPFKLLANDIEGASKRWKKYCEAEAPEAENLPQEWKNKTPLQKLCILRALRPDRMTYAVKTFIGQKMGPKYVDASRVPLSKSYAESSPGTPIFFILSPGVDPVKDVEALGRQLGYTEDKGNLHTVSLGQGQEVIAEQKLDVCYKNGGWVMLQNIHLVVKWLPVLEKKLEAMAIGAHENLRVFLSAEPAGDPAYHVIPISMLQSAIKITNEPPTGMQANILRAMDNFSQETFERSSKEQEFKSIIFELCYFHAVVLERKKFGTQGWNKPYPFSTGDLTISVDVLYNYLEAFSKVPWTDLRYMFAEIMYGGHISDDWDRRLCATYLDVYMKEDCLEGNFELAPGFLLPSPMDYKDYRAYVQESLPAESPVLYGLHPNAEIGVLTNMTDKLFKTILELQPRDAAGGAVVSREEKTKQQLDEMLASLPDSFNVTELMARVEERTPYINVALQECDRMSILTTEIRRSLKELDLGLKGDLTISESMEALMNALFFNEVPPSWTKLAYPSMNGLAAWFADLLLRIKELENWVAEFVMPSVVWLAGLFNPQSFLTAIMQTTARKNEWPLDKMALTVDVTKKTREEFTAPPREGAYIHGLYIEGARWDNNTGTLAESHMKELMPAMPVLYIRAIQLDKKETKGVYECPMYRTRQRGPNFVWTFNLKTKDKPSKWTLAGVALLLSSD